MRGCWPGEAGGWLTRNSIVCDWFGELIWLSLVGPKLEARPKKR